MISLRQLSYALAVEKTLHFKQAADMCSASQSALSTGINELEKQLGFQIFERNNKTVLITPQGQQFLDKAKTIKMQVDELYLLANKDNKPLSLPLKLGVIPTIAPYLLPKVLPCLRGDHPDFRLTITEDQSQTLVQQLRTGEIDAAILAMPYPIDGLLSFEFWREDFYWVCHKEAHPRDQSEIKGSSLSSENLMLLKEGHCLKEHALEACHLKLEEASLELEGTSLFTLIQMVAGKLGTTLIPHMAIEQLVDPMEELDAIHLDEPGPHRRIAFVVRANYGRVNDIQHLCQCFRKSLEEKFGSSS